MLRHRFFWKRLSMTGALAYRPDASEAALCFQIKEGSYNSDSLIEFLTDLHQHFGADKILNPIEMVWGNIKTVELANLCPDTLDEAQTAAHAGLTRVGTDYDLCFAFLAHTGLSL
jgi:hypothetical protein